MRKGRVKVQSNAITPARLCTEQRCGLTVRSGGPSRTIGVQGPAGSVGVVIY